MPFPSPVQNFHRDTYQAINPSNPQLSTKGRNVVITGGGSGLGPAIARSFATSGASSITLLGRTEKTLLETKAGLNRDFSNTLIYIGVMDIASKDSVTAAFDDIKSNIGKVDILVANAGIMSTWCLLAESTIDEWYESFHVNVKGNFNLIKEFLPIAAPKAVVINISAGMAHLQHFPKSLSYHASKLAAIKIFDYLHYENPNLFVINIHPGILKTGLGGNIPGRGTPHISYDTLDLASDFSVWAASLEAKFLNGKFVWANWDVDELKAISQDIVETDKFTIGLVGWHASRTTDLSLI